MENLKYLKIKMKVNGLDELNRKIYMLGYNYESMKSILKDSERLIEEINQLEIFVETGIDREKSSQ
ncbi:hypothetical protein [Anaerococcus tetradius]|uniref:Uncharacterized protein n=1 Tax=Anaerococcus tetradius ATCC 35098 TaxID=525255 RepID=C2CHK7_9FIRM|nr:hypothetical protein [Anaerococcus tetradius]EEI82962.1 hypothetical protein HMPREF0077_0967 [Anaerococcus tetradius ATCC 35098]